MEDSPGRRAVIVCGNKIMLNKRLLRFFENKPMIIAADGGAGVLRKAGIMPSMLVGDFDSLDDSHLTYFKNTGLRIHSYKKEKDMTDSEIALDFVFKALEAGENITEIVIISRAGGRIDHQLNNIAMLEKIIDRGIKAVAADEVSETAMASEKMSVTADRKVFKPSDTYISLIPVTEKVLTGKCTGFKYDPSDIEFVRGASRGISNNFTRDNATVTIKKGKMLVITLTENPGGQQYAL